MSKNAVFHERTKHVATKYHFIRDLINVGEVEVLEIATANNPADIFTKILPVFKLKEALKLLRISKDREKNFCSRRSSVKSFMEGSVKIQDRVKFVIQGLLQRVLMCCSRHCLRRYLKVVGNGLSAKGTFRFSFY